MDNISSMGVAARLIDMQDDIKEDELLSCDLIVNRVFASAVFRGHEKSLRRMPKVIDMLKKNNIPMINPYEAHFFEISKRNSTDTLALHGIPVPKVYDVFFPEQIPEESQQIEYPCVVKPDCGGRTNYTFIIKSYHELCRRMDNVPDIKFIAEEYICPEYNYLTRIEVIGRSCRLILKRSVAENGLSTYHLGSIYAIYDDCSDDIKEAAIKSMDILQIEMGSLDIIENQSGFYIIDANSVSNVSEDNTEMFDFDLMKESAVFVVDRYRDLTNT